MPNDLQPPNSGSSRPDVIGNESLDKGEILDLLSSDDTSQEKDDKGKQAKGSEDKIDIPEDKDDNKDEEGTKETEEIKLEDENGEEEEEQPSEEELDIETPVPRKEILAKYPNIFKDFPYLQTAYYRDQQFTEVFPTVNDAKEADEKAKVLDNFEADVMQGNTEKVLLAIKENDEKAFKKAVDNYLPTLLKVDQSAYLTVVGNVARQILSHAGNVGKQQGEAGEPLSIAVKILSQFVFGSENPGEQTRLVREDESINKEREELKRERENTVREKFESARSDLSSKVQNTLRATIAANIDPKDSMPEFVKKSASRNAYEALEAQMAKDERFKTIMNTLWRRGFDDGFSKSSLERIRSAYLSKARTLLPIVIKQSRNEALKGLGRNTNKDENTDRRGPIAPGKTAASTQSSQKTNPKEIPKGVSTLDFLNME